MFTLYHNEDPSISIMLAEIPQILNQLNLVELPANNNNTDEVRDLRNMLQGIGNDSFESDEGSFYGRRSMLDERALTVRGSLENSLVEQINTSVPSPDEIVIRQRGRKKQPAKISWSPMKSPFKTPTKKSSSYHMSLLSPSPAKKLFHNSSMLLRSSPRKRILQDTPENDQASSSTPVTSPATPTKRLKIFEDSSTSVFNDIPLRTLLKGLTQEQLVRMICDVSSKDPDFEDSVRRNIPQPDVRSFEDELCSARKSITRSSPRTRLISKTDGAAFTRAVPHLTAFKKAICKHCKVLSDSCHFNSLLEYVMIAWTYVRLLPTWDEPSHNAVRRECFRMLTYHAKLSLSKSGEKLGADRIASFRDKLKVMSVDFEEIGKCQEALNALV